MPPPPPPSLLQHARCLRQRVMLTTPPTTFSIVPTPRRFETASSLAPPMVVVVSMSHEASRRTNTRRLRFPLPRILQADMLKSYFPSFLWRPPPPPPKQKEDEKKKKTKKKEWNPYTFFIITFLVIGSQAINLIALKHEHKDFMRKTDSRIDLLREVIERIQKGEEEDVNVEKLLGVGVESEEKSWEDLLKEIEHEDLMWQERRASSKKKRVEKMSEEKKMKEEEEEKEEEGISKSEAAEGEGGERKLRVRKAVDDGVFL